VTSGREFNQAWTEHEAQMQLLPMIANQAKLEAIVGRKLPDDLFKFAPWGHRLIVVREEPVRKVGQIHVPEVAVEKLAEGWVLSVGHLVNQDMAAPLSKERLLGCKVVFGKYAGDNIGVTTKDPLVDQEQEDLFSILRDTDIWGTVGEPPKAVPL
jgi:chaperonin GroES